MRKLLSILAVAVVVGIADCGWAFEPELVFTPWKKAITVETAAAHFGIHLGETGWVQAWNVDARFSLIPFGIIRFPKCDGYCDGALEAGIGPVFERFVPENQNFAGLQFGLRYYLVHFEYGGFVPWIDASVAPGYTDLNIGRKSNETLLTGPFLNLIEGGFGGSYFVTEAVAVYLGLRAEHVSNAGFNGKDRNYALNTPFGMVMGASYYF
jgi:hypothetical protein